MPDLKPVYLVSGDDDAKIDDWRARLRRRAEEERGPGGLESFDARVSHAEEVATALAALTFDPGTRYLMVDDADAWKSTDLGSLETALADPPAGTVLVLVVRGKAPAPLAKAVESAGGELRVYEAPKPWKLPKWVSERGQELGLKVDAEAAKTLVSLVGPGQQRLARELEKLALALHPRANVAVEDVQRLAAAEAGPQAYDLADAIVAGDLAASVAIAQQIEAHGERAGRLTFPIVRRLREVHRAAALLEAGLTEQQVAESLKAPPWLAKKTVARARKADRASLERALGEFADLEVELRGGGEVQLDEDTAFTLALARAAG